MRSYALDPAHTLDKGIAQYMLGSLFKEVVYNHTVAPRLKTLPAQVEMLFNLIRDFYERNQKTDRLDKLALKDICNPKKPHKEYPYFAPGNMTKCRRLIPFGFELASRFSDGHPHDLHRVAAFKHLKDLYSGIYDSDDCLSDEDCTALQTDVD